jgi:hypothetical protein
MERHRWNWNRPFVQLAIDLALILGLTLFVGFLMVFQYSSRVFYHDNWSFYGLWRDQLHSLNRYGEIGWWAPHYQAGWPAYYYAILGNNNCSGPIFVLWGSLSWIAGRLGFQSDTFYVPYLINYSFVTPLLATLAAYAVLRQLFRNRTVIRFALILAAMSPSIVQNATSAGVLESLTYGLFLLAAYLYFLRCPSRLSFWLLGLATCNFVLTFNYPSLLENVVLLPAAVAVITFVPRGGWRRLWTALTSIPWWHYAALAACAVVCALPNAVALSQGTDIIRTSAGGHEYDADKMCVGNPLVGLVASTPNFGFNRVPGIDGGLVIGGAPINTPVLGWDKYYPQLGFGYYYVGMLCMPLVCLALSSAKPRVRRQLVILLAVVFGMMCLVMYSPAFSFVLRLVKLLRTNDHFHNESAIAASSCIYVVAAAVGLQLLIESPREEVRRRCRILFCVFAAISALVFVAILGQRVLALPAFSFLLLMAFLYLPVLGWLRPLARRPWVHGARCRRPRVRGARAAGLLLFLAFLDSSTFLHIYLREIRSLPYVHEVPDKRLPPGNIGFESTGEEQANNVMRYRQLSDMIDGGFDLGKLPSVLSVKAHTCQDVAREKALLASGPTDPKAISVALDEAFAKLPDFAPFLSDADHEYMVPAAQDPTPPHFSKFAVEPRSYNSVAIRAEGCSRPCLLFLRSAYSPYWTATVNSQPVPIARAWFNFQAIPVPKGSFELRLRFSPPWIREALVLAYLVLFGIGGLCCYYRLRPTAVSSKVVRTSPEVAQVAGG